MILAGIIGCGSIAIGRHIPAYVKNPRTKLAAVYDPVPGRAAETAEQYGAVPYENLEEMLAHPGLMAVSVCTPEKYHRDVVIKALRSGKHVLCEKPMAVDLDQALEMEEEAQKSGRLLMISHNQRIYEPHWKAKQLIEEGAVGKILSFRTFLSHNGPEFSAIDAGQMGNYYDRAAGNGGVMLSVGCHRIDLIPWILGKKILSVMAYTPVLDKRTSDGCLIHDEDTAMIIMKCEGGIAGMMYTGWCTYGCTDRETHIFGTEGVIKTFEDPWSVAVYKKSGEKIFYDLSPWAEKGSAGAVAIVDKFIECIAEKKPPFVSAHEGVECMRVLDAVRESDRSGRWVDVSR